MKFYVMLDNDNVIRDVIDYPHEGYIEIEAHLPLPVGVNGGWFKLENGQIVEYPELKPTDPEIEQLKQVVADLTELVLFGGAE